jgi:hypothetical protein
MEKEIPILEISKIIEDLCKKSETFKNFYKTEILKLKENPICWKYDSELVGWEGFSRCQSGGTAKKYEIVLKKHPTEFIENNNYFLIAHEIGHLVQYEEGYPSIKLHGEFKRVFPGRNFDKISGNLNSMIYDFSINSKLKDYGFEIPPDCFNPPNGEKSPAFNLIYILRYVLFRRYSLLVNERYEMENQDCLKKYNDEYLVTVGDKIFEIINHSPLIYTNGSINKNQIKPVIEEIFANLKEFFTLPYEFKLTFIKSDSNISIAPTQTFSLYGQQV